MKMQALILSLLLLTIVKIDGRSLDGQFTCATTCQEPVNFQYTVGRTYQYSYETEIFNHFHVDVHGGSELTMYATANVDVLSPCEMVLRLSHVGLNNVDQPDLDSDQWQQNMMRNPFHFSWHDGRVDDVCASNDDPEWVLNIKRGIVSAMQVPTVDDTASVTEIDVTGRCESSVEVDVSGADRTITKRKDYSKCVDRDRHLLFSHFTPYSSDSPRQNFIYSKQTCQQRVQSSMLHSVSCEEEHVFRPFSSEESGARTTIRQRLTLTGSRRSYHPDALGASDVRRTSLVFEKEPPMDIGRDISEIQQLYSDICATMDTDQYKQIGKDFVKMIFLLRRLDAPAIDQSYNALSGACPKWETTMRSMFQDALQWCGSEGCVVFATHLMAQGPAALDDQATERWLTGISLITEPTTAMLRGLTEVVSSGRLRQQTYLTTGTMIHRLCVSRRDCLADPTVSNALDLFERTLGRNCYTPDFERTQEIVLALRAIGNAGRSNAVSAIGECAAESRNSFEVRIAAMQAFRRMPCGSARALASLVFDTEQDAEIRINAYLTSMKCPTMEFMQRTVAMLDTEPVMQVASFVSSHLTQLIESTDPLKGYIKPYLVEVNFAKKYDDLSARKYSRYYESSFYSEALNAGATAESNLIWSPKSFVPRSAGVNVTVDVFGQAVNLFEIGGRVEGVEKMVQKLLEKDMKNTRISDLLMGHMGDDDDNDEANDDEPEPRKPRRRSPDEARLNEVSRQYQAGLHEDEPSASWYVRVFGNEMRYGTTRFARSTEDFVRDQLSSVMADFAKGREYNYHDDTMLVNSAHVLPTGVGLPLTLAFNGSASLNLHARGQLDMRALFQREPSLTLLGDFNPRAVVVVTGAMTINAHATRVGIQTESSSQTSWRISGRASLESGQHVNVRIDTPYDRNTVFSFNHQLLKVTGEEVNRIGEVDTAGVISSQCTDEYAGHRLCLEQPTTPSSIFPASGMVAYSVHAEKTDPGLTHYLMDGSYERSGEDFIPTSLSVQLSMSTPQSRVDRTATLRANYNLESMDFSVNLRRPNDLMDVRGSLTNNENSNAVMLSYRKNDDLTRFQAQLQHDSSRTKSGFQLATTLATPAKTMSANVDFSLNQYRAISFNATAVNVMLEPIVVALSLTDDSSYGKNRLRYQGDGQLTIPGLVDNGLKLEVNVKPRADSFVFGVTYQLKDAEEHNIRVVERRRDDSADGASDFNVDHKATFSQFPYFNHQVELSYRNGGAQGMRSYVKISYGRRAGNDDKYISVTQTFRSTEQDQSTRVEGEFELLVPDMHVEKHYGVLYTHNATTIDARLSYGENEYVSMMSHGERTVLVRRSIEMRMQDERLGSVLLRNDVRETSANVYDMNGQFALGKTEALSMRMRAHVENLEGNKVLRATVVGDNGQQLLSLSSEQRFIEPAGFSSENSLESKYNRLVAFNLRHEGNKDGGFESGVLFKHDPDVHMQFNVDSNNDETSMLRKAMAEFKDSTGLMRHVSLAVGTDSTPSRFDGKLSFVNNVFPVAENITSIISYGSGSKTYRADALTYVNNKEIVGGHVEYTSSETAEHPYVHTVIAEVRQGLNEREATKINTMATVETGPQATGGRFVLSIDQSRRTKSFTADLNFFGDMQVRGSIVQDLFAEVPANMVVTGRTIDLGITATVSFTGEHITLEAVLATPKSVRATLTHNASIMNGIPRSVVTTVSWGLRERDQKTGLFAAMLVDGSQNMKMEIFYDPRNYAVGADITNNVDVIPVAPSHLDFHLVYGGDSGTLTGLGTILTYGNDQIWQADLSIHSEQLNVRVWFSPETWNLPQFYELNVRMSEDRRTYEMGFGLDREYMSISAAFDGASSPLNVFMHLRSSSNFSINAGNYQLDFDLVGNSLRVNAQSERADITTYARTQFTVNLEQPGFRATFQQNIDASDPLIPRDCVITFETSSDPHSLRLHGRYNTYEMRYTASATPYHTDVSSETTKWVLKDVLQQNVWQSWNDVRCTSELVFDIFNLETPQVSVSSYYTVDRSALMGGKVAALLSSSSDIMTFTIRYDQNITDALALDIPAYIELDLSLSLPSNTVSAVLYAREKPTSVRNHISVAVRADVATNTYGIDINHNTPWLERSLGVQAVSSNCTFGYTDGFGGRASCEAIVDGTLYHGMASGNIRNVEEASMFELTTEMRSNIITMLDILPIDRTEIPTGLRATTEVRYDLLSGDLSGDISLASTITRHFYDAINDAEFEKVNHAEASVDMKLFNWNAAISGSHDFETEAGIPHNFRYELLASGSTDESPVYYKSVVMSITLDGKKQTASLTLNQNPVDSSLYAALKHNVTAVLKYGVPGNMSVTFSRRDPYNADISVVYDTAKKSVGLKFDYAGDEQKVIFYLYHNFDTLVERYSIPKTMGVEGQLRTSGHDAFSSLRFVWGEAIKTAQATARWEGSDMATMRSLNYRHSHNFTESAQFPRTMRLTLNKNFDNSRYEIHLEADRKSVDLEIEGGINDEMYHGSITLDQNFNTENFNRRVALSGTGYVSPWIHGEISLEQDRETTLGFNGDFILDSSNSSVRLHLEPIQRVTNMLPSTIVVNINANVTDDQTLNVDANWQTDRKSIQTISFNSGYDIEMMTAFAEMSHGSRSLRKSGVPRNFRLDADIKQADNHRILIIKIKRGGKRNVVTLTNGKILKYGSVYVSATCEHDVEEVSTIIPFYTSATVFGQASPRALIAQHNLTIGDTTHQYAATATYQYDQQQSIDGAFEITHDCVWLANLNVPHTIAASVAADWMADFSGSLAAAYGDKSVRVHMSSNLRTKAAISVAYVLHEQHSYAMTIVAHPENRNVDLTVTVDDVERQVIVAGGFGEASGQARISHTFEVPMLPNDVAIQGEYRLMPDMYARVDATVDGTDYGASANYNKLSNGFRLAVTMLDGIARQLEYHNTFGDGSFSIDVDHNVPELLEYVPGSVGVAASLTRGVNSNITAALRVQDTTHKLSAQANLEQFQLAFNHNLNIPALPRNIRVQLHETRDPVSVGVAVAFDDAALEASLWLNTNGIVASMSQNSLLPALPGSILITANYTLQPLVVGGVSVTIDGIEREALIELDRENMQMTAHHAFPILNDYFVPSDLVVRIRGTLEPLSGEIYTSIDGYERQARVVADPVMQMVSMVHSVPEFENVPRAISVSVSGTLKPLDASITLGINDVERTLSASGDMSSATITHTIPELESFLPRDLGFTLAFTEKSGEGGIRFSKDGVEYSFASSAKVGDNNLQLTLDHNIDLISSFLPEKLAFDLAGSKKFGNFSTHVLWNTNFINVDGEAMLGQGEEGWYGAYIAFGHNLKQLRRTTGITRNMVATCKVRVVGQAVEAILEFNNGRHNDYTSVSRVNLVNTEVEQYLKATYEDMYNGVQHTFNGKVGSEVEDELRNLVVNLTFTGDQELALLRDGHLSVTISPSRKRAQSLFRYALERQYVNFSGEGGLTERGVNIRADYADNSHSFFLSSTGESSGKSYRATYQAAFGDRQDRIVATLNADARRPRLELIINQPELNNLGAPSRIVVALKNKQQSDFDWTFLTTVDDEQLEMRAMLGLELCSSVPCYFLSNYTLIHNMNLLTDLGVPANMGTVMEMTSAEGNWTGHVNEQFFTYKYSQGHTEDLSYNVMQSVRHNLPLLKKYVGWFSAVWYFSTVKPDTVLHADARIVYDNVEVATYNFIMDTDSGAVSYSQTYNDNGYHLVYNYNIDSSQFNFLAGLEYNQDPVYLANLALRYGHSIKAEFVIPMITVAFNATADLTLPATVEQAPASLLVVYDDVSYRANVTISPYLHGQKYAAAYSTNTGDALDVATVITSYSDDRSTYEVAMHNTICDVIPSATSLTVIRAENLMQIDVHTDQPHDLSVDLHRDSTGFHADVNFDSRSLLHVQAGEQQFDVIIRDLTNVLFSSHGRYEVTTFKRIDFTVQSIPLNTDFHMLAKLHMFEEATGNSSLLIEFDEPNFHREMRLEAFAVPTGKHSADFLTGLELTSTYNFIPLNTRLCYNSSYDIDHDIYSQVFRSFVLGNNFNLAGNYSVDSFDVVADIGVMTVPKWTISGRSVDGDNSMRTVTVLNGYDRRDTMTLIGKWRSSDLLRSYVGSFVQPSGHSLFLSLNMDKSTASRVVYGINGKLDADHAGLNVSYTGVLPKVYGEHLLTVDIAQPFVNEIPSQFTTTGNMIITGSGYRSYWFITSFGSEIVRFDKVFSKTADSYDMNILWRQSYYSVPLSYLSINTTGSMTSDRITSQSAMQVDSTPTMSYKIDLQRSELDSRSNSSIALRLSPGPLATYIAFRSLAFDGWYKHESSKRAIQPQLSATLNIDGYIYHIATDVTVSSGKTSRFTTDITLQHPCELILFTYTLPQQNTLSLNTLSRSKGTRVVLAYQNERMPAVFKVTNNYRLNNGDMLFEAQSKVQYNSVEEDAIVAAIEVVRDQDDLDYLMTTTLKHPSSKVNLELQLGGVNNDERVGAEMLCKDYGTERDLKTWQARMFFTKSDNVITLTLNTPQMERPITLRGDLSQVIEQGSVIFRRIAAGATHTRLSFVKGFEEIDNGYDMYVGYEVDGDATYTLHLTATIESAVANVVLAVKRDFVVDSEVARASVALVDGQIIKFELSANPIITRFVKKLIVDTDREFSRKTNWLAANANELIDALRTVITGDRKTEESIGSVLDMAVEKVDALRTIAVRFVAGVSHKATGAIENGETVVQEAVRDGLVTAMQALNEANAVLSKPFEQLVDTYLGAALAPIKQRIVVGLAPVRRSLARVNAGELLIDLIDDAINSTLEFVRSNGDAALFAIRGPVRNLVIVTDSEIIVRIPLSINLDHFTPLPTSDEVKGWLEQTALAVKINDVVDILFSYVDDYYRWTAFARTSWVELLPPFKGHAFVSDFRHFSTFDQRTFDFASGCGSTHVLAADMRDRNFTVTMTFGDDGDRRNAIDFRVGPDTLVMFDDSTMALNGRSVPSLPLETDSGMVAKREGSVITLRRLDDGVTIMFDVESKLLTVDVSPYYFGSTAGLLGLFNNEPYDDLTNPISEKLSDVTEFAHSWEVSDASCTSANTYRSCDVDEISDTCQQMFTDSSSPFRACFPVVNPEPFLAMCVDDMCSTSVQSKSCAAAGAYHYRCALAGVPLPAPAQCLSCSTTNGEDFAPEDEPVSTETTGADLVLVMQEGSCMKGKGSLKSIRKLYKNFASGFSSAGMRDNRYYLVGYGGPSTKQEPHTYTIRNEIFTERRAAIPKVIGKIDLSRASDNPVTDALAALSHATKFSFRAGAAPIVVLLSCDECQESSEVPYHTVAEQMRAKGIKFHHVPMQSISAEGTPSKGLLGYDAQRVFHTQQNEVSSSVVQQSRSDMCVPLATSTGGSIWDGSSLLGSSSTFPNMLGEYVTSNIPARQAQTCSCVVNEAGVPSAVCAA